MVQTMAADTYLSPDVEKALAHHKDKLAGSSRSADRKDGMQRIFNDYVKIINTMVQSQIPGDDNTVKMAELAQLHLSMSQAMATEDQTAAVQSMETQYMNTQMLEAANHIGKLAQVESNTFEYDPQHETPITYEVPPEAATVDIVISKVEKRKSGAGMASDMGVKLTQVAAFEGRNAPGKNTLKWDGKIVDKNRPGEFIEAEKGTYHVNIILKDENGKELYDGLSKKPVQPKVYVTGFVNGAAWDKGKPCIRIGDSIHGIDTIIGFEKYDKEETSKNTQKRAQETYEKMKKFAERRKAEREQLRNLGMDLAGRDIPSFESRRIF